MTASTFAVAAPTVADYAPRVDLPAESTPTPDAPVVASEAKAPSRKTAGKKAKTFELTLTVTGTADGEWRAEIKQGSTYLVRNVPVAAAAVSRAAKELHEELFTPIEALMDEARCQQAAKVAALEAELEAARKALADLD
ncbi:DUF6319 family protein [Mycolicibacter sinensis]|uniref:Mucin n=1 Tax=Mycolicibacter sinensis (strain JDM601) TaxID=875328 RepID=A0A1A3U4E2_MYCSD|nr:DUF6319 family protein [Mycolicibacter sinensis]OBK89557.1 hypothetical protein A5648_20160 [Mycolicibacter sinensis]